MRKIYTAIDIGSDSIKIVVSEFFNKKFHILASSCVPSKGVKRGLIVDKEAVSSAIKKATSEIENTIGIRISEALVTVSSNNRKLSVTSGNIEISGEKVTGEDVVNVLSSSVIDKIEDGYELVTAIPIVFSVDDNENISDPKGRVGTKLGVKSVLVTIPKENLFSVLEVCNLSGIEAKDVIFTTIGDYYEARGSDTEREVGAVVDIGSDTINVSIFNKGIIIKDDIINLGSRNIDKDISYVYGVDISTARELKENFAVCSRKYADSNDIIEIKLNEDDVIKINQYEISEVVESRVSELLKLAKKSINNLTNRKISYIIVTGGLSELTGFGYVVENVLGINASTLNVTTVGIRNNKYSASMGAIKYFHEKLRLRGIEYSMFNESSLDDTGMFNKKNLLNINNGTFIGKIFGYFTNN